MTRQDCKIVPKRPEDMTQEEWLADIQWREEAAIARQSGHLKQWILDHVDEGNEGDRKAREQYERLESIIKEIAQDKNIDLVDSERRVRLYGVLYELGVLG